MAGVKEIRTRIKSVESTLKITNAMYLISSASLRKARAQLQAVYPYFSKISSTIADILHHAPDVHHPYFDTRPHIPPGERKTGIIIITSDKGLAGSYNHNVLKLAEKKIAETGDPQLFLVGQMGRSWFTRKGKQDAAKVSYSAQNPDLKRARQLSFAILDQFRAGELDEVWLIYTKMVTPLHLEPTLTKLLPLERDLFPREPRGQEPYRRTVAYLPSETQVMDRLAPGYFAGMIFGGLVESFCSEQSARMTAMDSSSKNAKDVLKTLNLHYNRARQAAITQEITEVVGGAKTGRS